MVVLPFWHKYLLIFFFILSADFDERVERNIGEHRSAAVSTRGCRIAGKAGEV